MKHMSTNMKRKDMTRIVIDKAKEVELNGKRLLVEFVATLVEDPNYGADADGRRGTYASWWETDIKEVIEEAGRKWAEKEIDDNYDALCDLLEKDLHEEIELP